MLGTVSLFGLAMLATYGLVRLIWDLRNGLLQNDIRRVIDEAVGRFTMRKKKEDYDLWEEK